MAGPKVSCTVHEHEALLGEKGIAISYSIKHLEQTVHALKSFIDKVEALFKVLNEMGNSFQESLVIYWCWTQRMLLIKL